MSQENPFENEIEKLKWMLKNGFITPEQVQLYADFYGVNPYDILKPTIVIARPSKFDEVKQKYGELAGIADPYSRTFPIVSLLSLEKAINSIANRKVPWRVFDIVVDESYADAPLKAIKLLYDMVNILNKNGYNVKLQLPPTLTTKLAMQSIMLHGNQGNKKFSDIAMENINNIELPEDLKKVECHLMKMFDRRVNCDDTDWYKYNIWSSLQQQNRPQLDEKLIKDIAVRYGLPVVVVRYIVMSQDNPRLLEKYKKSFNLDDMLVNAIINAYKNGNVGQDFLLFT